MRCLAVNVITLSLALNAFALSAVPSLKSLVGQSQAHNLISDLEQQSQIQPNILLKKEKKTELERLKKQNQKCFQEFSLFVREGVSFVRGEVDQSETQKGLESLLTLSLLRVRLAALDQELKPTTRSARIRDEIGLWFRFAADLPYNEATKSALFWSHQVRIKLLLELENLEPHFRDLIEKDHFLLTWLMQIRTPWPIDRVVLSESRLRLKSDARYIGEKVAIKLQKNPYLSIAQTLKQIPGKKQVNTEPILSLWTSEDILQMQEEQNRIQNLRLRWASFLYFGREKKWPTSSQDLVKAKYISQVPIDYITGKPLVLPQFDKSDSRAKSP